MHARIAGATVKLQLDVSTGDPVTPPPTRITYPTLREVHAPVPIFAYPLPVVLAEKLRTAVDLGPSNTRVRDYADIWTLTTRHDVSAGDLLSALAATSTHRRVTLRPLSAVLGEYANLRQPAYRAFRGRLGPDGHHLPAEFADVVTTVIAFADPVLRHDIAPTSRWHAARLSWRAT